MVNYGKVKVTERQAEQIELVKEMFSGKMSDDDKIKILRTHESGWEDRERESLNDISISDFAEILLSDFSYKVQSNYNLGKLVKYTTRNDDSVIGIISDVSPIIKDAVYVKWDSETDLNDDWIDKSKLELITVKEARKIEEEIFFKSLGRNHKEFHSGDKVVVSVSSEMNTYTVSHIGNKNFASNGLVSHEAVKIWFDNGFITGITPYSDPVSIPDWRYSL